MSNHKRRWVKGILATCGLMLFAGCGDAAQIVFASLDLAAAIINAAS